MMQQKTVVAATAAVCLFACGFYCPQSASGDETSSMPAEVSNLETLLYGQATPDAALTNRLNTLEETTFGHAQSGPFGTRLQALQRELLEKPSDQKAPSKTPSMTVSTAPETQGIEPLEGSTTPHDGKQQVDELLKEGVTAEKIGDDATARRDFENAAELDPQNDNAYFSLAVIEEKSGHLQSAWHLYEQALQLKPGDRDAEEAIQSVQRRLAFNNNMPAPLQSNLRLDVQGGAETPPGPAITSVQKAAPAAGMKAGPRQLLGETSIIAAPPSLTGETNTASGPPADPCACSHPIYGPPSPDNRRLLGLMNTSSPTERKTKVSRAISHFHVGKFAYHVLGTAVTILNDSAAAMEAVDPCACR